MLEIQSPRQQRHCPQGEREGYRSLCTRPCHYRRHRHILHTLVGVDGETYGRLRVVLCVWWCCGGVVVFRGVLKFKKGFWVCGSGGVFESCTFYLHDGRANRGCPANATPRVSPTDHRFPAPATPTTHRSPHLVRQGPQEGTMRGRQDDHPQAASPVCGGRTTDAQ